jgi:hypothetical protein
MVHHHNGIVKLHIHVVMEMAAATMVVIFDGIPL